MSGSACECPVASLRRDCVWHYGLDLSEPVRLLAQMYDIDASP